MVHFNMKFNNFILCILFCCYALAASANRDSLWTVWQDDRVEDTIRLDASIDLIGRYYVYDNPDSAFVLAEQQLDFAISIKDKKWEAISVRLLGVIKYVKADYAAALKYYEQAIELFEAIGDTERRIDTYTNLALIYEVKGEYKEALSVLKKVYSIQEDAGYEAGFASTLYSLGNCYYYTGNFPLALKSYLEGIAIAKKYKQVALESSLYQPLASLYLEMKEYDLAEEYIHESINRNLATADSFYMVYDYNTLASIYEAKNQVDDAKTTYLKSIAYAKIDGMDYSISQPLLDFSKFLFKQNDPTVLTYTKQLIQSAIDLEQKDKEGYGYILEGKFHYKQGAYNKASTLCQKGYQLTKNSGNLAFQNEACECLYQAFKAIPSPQKALFYHEKFMAITDSLFNEKNTKELTQLAMQHEFDEIYLADSLQHAQEISLLNANNLLLTAQRKNYLLAIVSTSILALLASLFFWKTKKQNQRIQEQRDELAQLNFKKDQLFTIISHDLRKPALAFRSISKKIHYLVEKQEYARLDEFGASLEQSAFKLNSLLDNLLNWALQQRDLLPYSPQSINILESTEEIYEQFAPIANEKEIQLEFDIDSETTVFTDPKAFMTIVRNLLDNAIKFTSEKGKVVFSAMNVKEGVRLNIRDTGVGMNERQIAQLFQLQQNKSTKGTADESGAGLGMTLVKDLVELNKGTIKVNSEMMKGTSIEILFPIEER